jgi:hypothetical protein
MHARRRTRHVAHGARTDGSVTGTSTTDVTAEGAR